MAPVELSEMTYYAVRGDTPPRRRTARADALVDGLAAHAATLRSTPATVDYFATSLPTILLFQDDLQAVQTTTAMLLEAQVAALRGDLDARAACVDDVLAREPSRLRALDLRRELSDAASPRSLPNDHVQIRMAPAAVDRGGGSDHT